MTWLIASLGTSPSVITEALWYLETQKKLSIDHMTCVATHDSWAEAMEKLFKPDGPLDRLRRALGKSESWMTEGNDFQKVIVDAKDNRSLEEARAMDAAFRKVVKEAQTHEGHDGPVIACISGGRKTMSSSLQQAMTLLARSEDWAFHVLLNAPEGVEELAVMRSGFGFPKDPNHPEFSEVGVDAFEVPLVRLRRLALGKKIDLTNDDFVMQLQVEVDKAVELPRVELDLRTLFLKPVNSPEVGLKLSPQHAMLLAAFSRSETPMKFEDSKVYLEAVVNWWKTNIPKMEGTRIIPAEFDELGKTINGWFGEDPKYFDQQCSRLKSVLTNFDLNYEIFAIRTHERYGPKGFDPMVYGKNLILIRVIPDDWPVQP